MCRFSGPVDDVGATKILAGDRADGRQLLIYEMDAAFGAPVAMVLPLPVPADGPDDAVGFVDLSAHADLFAVLEREFPRPAATFGAPQAGRSAAPLAVHRVGAYEASFVARPADFARLDPRFRLGPDVLAALPEYADWGFAVFQLAADGAGRAHFHPMGLTFPRRDRDALFFPTGHVHDGTVHATAAYDHRLYAQVSPAIARHLDWAATTRPLGATELDCAAIGLDPARPLFAMSLTGEHVNRDGWLRAGDLEPPTVHGPSYAARVRVPALVRALPGDAAPDQAAVRAAVDDATATLARELSAVVAAHGAGWSLAPLTDELPRRDWWALLMDGTARVFPCAVQFVMASRQPGVQLEVTPALAGDADRAMIPTMQRALAARIG